MKLQTLDLDRMTDDGCPNHCDDERTRVALPELFKEVQEHSSRFHAQHRAAIHAITIGLIATSLLLDAAFKPADWLFVALSVLYEVRS